MDTSKQFVVSEITYGRQAGGVVNNLIKVMEV
jgi:hypothetical protein